MLELDKRRNKKENELISALQDYAFHPTFPFVAPPAPPSSHSAKQQLAEAIVRR